MALMIAVHEKANFDNCVMTSLSEQEKDNLRGGAFLFVTRSS